MDYRLIKTSTPHENLTVVEQVFLNRGISPSEIGHYLNTTDEDIYPPELLDNIDAGARLLCRHIAQNNKIFIQVDTDVDGFTSAALLLNYLHLIFPYFVENNIIYRLHEGKQHGVIVDTVPEDVKLVIIPDAGSNQYEEHAALQDKGIDVLVIDHHESDTLSPYACIINNQMCDYPTKSLSGVGIVYKFCCYLDKLLDKNNANKFLDLVALGCVADVMDLRAFETRHLVKKGLQQLRNPYFYGMVQKSSHMIGDELTPRGVAFYIAPYINATIRVGLQDEKLILFESMLDYRGYEQIPSTKRGCKGQVETRVEQACRNCTNIKNKQTNARDASLSVIEHAIEEQNLLDNKILLVKLQPDYNYDKNLSGLIANQLMGKYQRPVLLLNQVVDDETKEIRWEGSGRGCSGSSFEDFKGFLNQSGYINWAEGHANAFGASFNDAVVNDFITYSNFQLKDIDFSPCYKVDFIFDANNFSSFDILEIANLKSIWGQGIDEPYIAIENIKVTSKNLYLMKSNTLKIVLPNGMSLIKFRVSDEEYEALYSELGCVTINVVGTCERNVYNGIISPQVTIENYEIVSKSEYYF